MTQIDCHGLYSWVSYHAKDTGILILNEKMVVESKKPSLEPYFEKRKDENNRVEDFLTE